MSVWLLLLFGSTVLHMQFMEFFFSITMAAAPAYSSYIFSLVPPAHYPAHSPLLTGLGADGRLPTSSVLGQLLVTMGRVPFSTLNYISLAFLTFQPGAGALPEAPQAQPLLQPRRRPVRAGPHPPRLHQMNPGPRRRPPSGGLAAGHLAGLDVRAHAQRAGRAVQLPQLRLWSLWWVTPTPPATT